ncbi:E3 ubiquitin-protein ligase HOS1 isoform X2 [Cryptomeria japonica]|nr:E3 ubiquitin-protein ligase HOS1 isoform X2 [Cryptomeria japonica]XP_057812710.2 E3 ubiquitin-protein ligase HOS1 isoform X2 [Cryptomeria japonica]
MEGDAQFSTEDVQRLYSLFDVALDNNLVSLVCHYVTDVCMDESAVSNDPIVAMLLDGAVVKEWCKRKLLNVTCRLQEIYNLGVKEMQNHYDLLSKFTMQLDSVGNVLEVLEEPLLESPSPQLVELQLLSETVSKVKQHMEAMTWCARHEFLEGVQCRYMSISHWRSVFNEKKVAASERAWPDYLNNATMIGSQSPATLFIEDALANLSTGHDYDEELETEFSELGWLRQGGVLSQLPFKSISDGSVYPPENLRAAVDLLFLEGSSDLILAKRAIFLYYLFDRLWNLPNVDWRNLVDDYAGTFGITRQLVLESLVFYLLDDSTSEALEEACRILPEIVGSTTHPKIARVLLERQNPDAALMVLRCSGRDGQLGVIDSGSQRGSVATLPEAVTAVRVRLECGLLTEAYLYQRTHCLRIKAGQSKHRRVTFAAQEAEETNRDRDWLAEMEVLVGEICFLCIRRKLVDRMIELPWYREEERFMLKCLLEINMQDPSCSAGSLLVVFFIQRCRYIEAYQIHRKLCNLEEQFISESADEKMVERVQNAREWRTRLTEKCIELLPEIQRQQLRSGNISECSFSPCTREKDQCLDLEKEREISSILPITQITSTGMPGMPSLINQPFDARKRELTLDTFNRSKDFPLASPLGWGDYIQPSILHGKPFRSAGTNPLPVTSPILDRLSNKRDQERPRFSPIQARVLKYDFDSGKALEGSESAEHGSQASDYMPSQELHILEKGVAFKTQPSKELFSDLSPSTDERRRFEVLNKAQNETRNLFENGHSISEVVLPGKDNHLGLENGFIQTRDLPSTSYLYAPHSSTEGLQERSNVATPTIGMSTHRISSPGSNGKRLPSDRSWLAGPSDADFWRGKGSGTVPSSCGAKDQDLSPVYSSAESFHTSKSGVESSKLNGGLRWRSDEGEQEDGQRPKRSGKLKGSSGSKAKSIGRSRFYASSIA